MNNTQQKESLSFERLSECFETIDMEVLLKNISKIKDKEKISNKDLANCIAQYFLNKIFVNR